MAERHLIQTVKVLKRPVRKSEVVRQANNTNPRLKRVEK